MSYRHFQDLFPHHFGRNAHFYGKICAEYGKSIDSLRSLPVKVSQGSALRPGPGSGPLLWGGFPAYSDFPHQIRTIVFFSAAIYYSGLILYPAPHLFQQTDGQLVFQCNQQTAIRQNAGRNLDDQSHPYDTAKMRNHRVDRNHHNASSQCLYHIF